MKNLKQNKTNVKLMGSVMNRLDSNYYTYNDLYEAYPSGCSVFKHRAFKYCEELKAKFKGWGGKIISKNSMQFSYAFYGEYENEPALFYITKDNNRVILLKYLQ